MARILRGDVVWADLDPIRGHEQAGYRLVVVISRAGFNERLELVIAMAVTSRRQPVSFPFTMEIKSLQMPRRSWALISQIRTLSTARLGDAIGRISDEELDTLIRGLNTLVARQ